MKRSGGNPFLEGLGGTRDPMTRAALASFYAKQRLRMVEAYRYAELRGLLVAGSAHLSEDLLGLFVKFGVDDCADIMPLKGLYRSQVLQLAAWLGVPEEVIRRSPDPEMLAGIEDKYLDVFGLPSATVDLILYGIRGGMEDEEIAERTGIDARKAAELRRAMRLSAHMRSPSLSVDPLG